MNGEFVAFEDAKVHVLTHALHYGTGVFEGVRATRPDGTRRSSATATTSTACSSRRALLHGDPVLQGGAAGGHARADRAQRLQVAATSARSSTAAPARWACTRSTARSRSRSRSGSGAPTSATRASRTACARKVSSLAADRPRLADPARPRPPASTSTRSWPRSRPTRPATRRASCSTSAAWSARARARTCSSSRTAGSPRRASPRRSSAASTARRAIEIARDLGYELVERDIARGELYLADEVFMTGTAAELTPLREIDDHAVGTGRPGPITARGPGHLRGRAARPRGALRALARRRAAPVPAP